MPAVVSIRNGEIRWTLTSQLKYLDYADDVCLLSHKIMDMHQMIATVERETYVVELKTSTAKTKINQPRC